MVVQARSYEQALIHFVGKFHEQGMHRFRVFVHCLRIFDISIELLFFQCHALLIEFKLALLDVNLLQHDIAVLVQGFLQRTFNSGTTTTTTSSSTISGNSHLLFLVAISTFLHFLFIWLHSQGGATNNFSRSHLFFLVGCSILLVTLFVSKNDVYFLYISLIANWISHGSSSSSQPL
jgi:hypothetical protein